MTHLIVVADSEERMQGVIRGVEALDKNHNVAIMHGVSDSTVDDIVGIIAEVAQAKLLVATLDFKMSDEAAKKNLPTIYITIPKELEDRDSIISYIKTNYDKIVDDIVNL